MNTEQKAAATDDKLDVCVASGPGTGKTTTLVAAVEHDVTDGDREFGIPVVITFTNAAAAEIKRRLSVTVGYVGTLHGFCLQMLRRADRRITLIDEEEAERILKITADQMRYKGTNKELAQARVDFWKKKQILGSYTAAERVVLAYSAALVREHLLEYDLLLARAYHYIQTTLHLPVVKFFIDEFQDSSQLDMNIYDRYPHTKMFTVGDIDQCIYTFRGSDPEVMLDFYNRSSQHILNKNYRSTYSIVQAANRLISHNKNRVSINLVPKENYYADETIPVAHLADDAFDQDYWIEYLISRLNKAVDTIAILCRTNVQVASLSAFLTSRGIKVVDNRGTPIPDLSRVRTLIGLALNPQSDILRRVECSQRRSNDPIPLLTAPATTLTELFDFVKEHHVFSDPMRVVLDQVLSLCPETQPYRIFEFLQNREVHRHDAGIQIGTIHWAKGQEFDRVIIAHADEPEGSSNYTEEERRLFYVAITRAKKSVYVVGMRNRYVEFKGMEKRELTKFVDEADFRII